MEHRHQLTALVLDANVIQAGTAFAADFAGRGGQHVVAQCRRQVVDAATQGHGTCHGGFLFALADSAFAFACNSYDEATVALGCSIDYVAPALCGDLLTATASEQSRKGRTGLYDVRIENQRGELIALFHGKSYKVRGTVLAQEKQDD